jgi:hypothetical protein
MFLQKIAVIAGGVCLLSFSAGAWAVPPMLPHPPLHDAKISGDVSHQHKPLAYAPVEIRLDTCEGQVLVSTKTDTRGHYRATVRDFPFYNAFYVTTPAKGNFAATCSQQSLNFTASGQKQRYDIVVPVAKPSNVAQLLKAAEAKWQQKRPQHYAYTLQRSCFCTEEYRKPISIRVFNGKVQQATLLPEGKPLPAERKGDALTVEGLFAIIRTAITNKAASIEVKYDPQYGFPTTIAIDQDRRMADEEINITASNFAIASGLKPKQGK